MENLSESQFYGPNLGYVLELYDNYLSDPDSVDEATRKFFEGWSPPREIQGPSLSNGHGNGYAGAAAEVSEVEADKVVGAAKYIRSLRDFGHSAARLDPLGSEPVGDPALDPAFHEISEDDLYSMPSSIVGVPLSQRTSTAGEAVQELKRIYTSTTGYDFGHIHIPAERFWLRDAVESERFHRRLDGDEARSLLKRLTRVDTFEKFLHRTFLGQKRFSIEGVDMTVPMLNLLARSATDREIPEMVLGMAHRGRLNVLAHVLDKPYARIFGEFQQPDKGEDSSAAESTGDAWVGDVKYHLGVRGFHLQEGQQDSSVLVNLAPNPSHLEHVNPVVEGMARAAQEDRSEKGAPAQDGDASLAVLIHGDAAFPGEGVSAETLNLSRLPGYHTGGTIHVITNNQIGFTTEHKDARSTTYASDLAKGYEIPVVHVNADDPEACLAAARMAFAYREEFGKDFLIDLVGYRRFGHNEGDEPNYTQPRMYEIISNHPSVRERWADTLLERGILEEGEPEQFVEEISSRMEEIRNDPSDVDEEPVFDRQLHTPLTGIPDTGVESGRLLEANEALLELPEGFTPNSKLYRLLSKNRGGLDENGKVDWAHAESLAFASLLQDGYPIRLTGQDTARGTFSQRHATLWDVETGAAHTPLQTLPGAEASFAVHNSPLSEIAAMGFEYGYSVNSEDAFVLWEAQYGDFANVAQPMIDQFVVSGQAKWGQMSNLTLLLPHGYEGQGPEHSSARLERFLQLAAHENIRVANLTTAAQYFHLLRAQASLTENQRPLVVMSPKSLLRHPLAASPLTELTDGGFHPVFDDGTRHGAESVERLILCSGKIYTELAGSDAYDEAENVAVGRVELLYPFPEERLRKVIEGYPNLREIAWVQEEPQNMGAWFFAEPRLRALLEDAGYELPVRYVGKPARPSPAQGSARFHKEEHAAIVREAFQVDGPDGGKVGAQKVRERAPTPSE
ncbi:2-oxoglutarate dehydrogenase E1 component [Rubrobacter aplysinae]|uniref:2-oxoglutarate dehydrogenase E1 component n=1 Tax=Rubrobacter aplysinae TaxID=909625 RepID=UPI000A4DDD54|nr:2-oxoglutarate dehydrogenase E1 component [Rubrobacter aplysinae]